MNETILSVSDLQTHLHTDDGLVRAVDGLSFEVDRNETVCLVGESGSGKTMACNTVMGMVDPPANISGEVRFEERICSASRSRSSPRFVATASPISSRTHRTRSTPCTRSVTRLPRRLPSTKT
ncbi:ATP-binding cassette domain-containing protein [Halovenus salina]|uniref:ATP-binding cassette domain-containing protein n=1 Tax=Halovenus salina TaxID=1510225 RepID=A0ABD5W370_9EURY